VSVQELGFDRRVENGIRYNHFKANLMARRFLIFAVRCASPWCSIIKLLA